VTVDLDRLVVATEGWAGSDLAALPDAVGTDDVEALLSYIEGHTPGSTEWLSNARTMIRSLDSYGRVDDLVGYLQRCRLL
jgi:hypothetical protein